MSEKEKTGIDECESCGHELQLHEKVIWENGNDWVCPNCEKINVRHHPNKTRDRKNLALIRKMTKPNGKAEYEKAKEYYRKWGECYIGKDGLFHKELNDFWFGHYKYKEDGKCLRCGKCCKLPDKDGNMTDVDCGLLKRLEDGTTECIIYDEPYRIGCQIDADGLVPASLSNTVPLKILCIPRHFQSEKIEGCPYNNELKGYFN